MGIEKHLEEAYLQTTYIVYTKNKEYSLHISEFNEEFMDFCSIKKITKWAIITAYNPYSELCSLNDNEDNNKKLKKIIEIKNFLFFDAEGVPEDDSWSSEKSFFVYNINKEQAIEIGNLFKQNAIVYGSANSTPELLFLV